MPIRTQSFALNSIAFSRFLSGFDYCIDFPSKLLGRLRAPIPRRSINLPCPKPGHPDELSKFGKQSYSHEGKAIRARRLTRQGDHAFLPARSSRALPCTGGNAVWSSGSHKPL